MTAITTRKPTRVIRGGRGPMGPAGVGLRAWQTIDADHSAVTGDRLVCDSTAAGFTVTLPAGGGEVWLRDLAGSFGAHAVLVDGNGRTLDGDDTLTCDAAGYEVHLTSSGETWLYAITFIHGSDA